MPSGLFVHKNFRTRGIDKVLLEVSKAYCIAKAYEGLALEMAGNHGAPNQYERLDSKRDSLGFHYFWTSERKS